MQRAPLRGNLAELRKSLLTLRCNSQAQAASVKSQILVHSVALRPSQMISDKNDSFIHT